MNQLKLLRINHIKNLLTIINACVLSDKSFEAILFKMHEAYSYIIETNLLDSTIISLFTGINQKLLEMINKLTEKERPNIPENFSEVIDYLFDTLINSSSNTNALNENIQM